MGDFYSNLISGLIGAILIYLVQWVYQSVKERRAPYTGTWYDAIFDDHGNVVKEDLVKIRQRGDTLVGKIYRTNPAEQGHREWRFTGKIRGTQFFAIFWSVTQDVPSYGCWYLTQLDEDHFAGYYLSLQRTVSEGEGIVTQVLVPTRITLERQRV